MRTNFDAQQTHCFGRTNVESIIFVNTVQKQKFMCDFNIVFLQYFIHVLYQQFYNCKIFKSVFLLKNHSFSSTNILIVSKSLITCVSVACLTWVVVTSSAPSSYSIRGFILFISILADKVFRTKWPKPYYFPLQLAGIEHQTGY